MKELTFWQRYWLKRKGLTTRNILRWEGDSIVVQRPFTNRGFIIGPNKGTVRTIIFKES